jgi:hypothetical protein
VRVKIKEVEVREQETTTGQPRILEKRPTR